MGERGFKDDSKIFALSRPWPGKVAQLARALFQPKIVGSVSSQGTYKKQKALAGLAQQLVLAQGPKGLGFDSWSGARTWVASLIPSSSGGRVGGSQPMRLSHIDLSLSLTLPLALPLYLEGNGKISLGEDYKNKIK
uniref:Uncharacterized protein n=1 Tax=Molossus molossus TaxID=27622 RepID=A0A7J8GRH9_MOLMO|nr:hypothetical protein HJG59_011267 [Molossus molossus]